MRHTTSLSRRAAALLLALLLAMPAGYAAAGEQKIQTSTQIVDGLTYRNTVTVNNGRRVESYALELAPDAAAQPILVQGSGTIYAGASINKAVANAQAAGWHVLGGINSDFFSMATDFAKAALGAEGCGKDVTMIVGNGYTKDHAEITLSELRENAGLKAYFEKKYL